MKINGTSVLHATPERVWAAINDPSVLAGVIPGCEALNPLGEGHFGLTVSMGVAAIRGTYAGEVRLYDLVEPRSLTMRAAGAGSPGTVDTTVGVTLTDLGDGTTRLDYDADAVVGGIAGGVGQRVLTSVAKKTAGLFFSAIDDVLTGKRAVTAAPPPAGAAPVAAGARPEAVSAGAPAQGGAQPFGATLAAAPAAAAGPGLGSLAFVAVGAAAVAIGVLIGARIARRAH
jgi:carbon monoxide dehydrogenase subunit G